MTVLGISVGTRTTGICVLEDGKLIDANLHEYHEPWSDTKLHIIIKQYQRYIRKYNVIAVMIMVPPAENHSQEIKRIMKAVDKLAQRYHCEFDLTTNLELKSTYDLSVNEDVPRKVKALFPELATSESKHFKRFYEAILTAYFYQERLKKKQ